MKKRSDPTAQTQMLQRELREIFKVDRKFPDRLASHESSSVEFKESFNFKAFSRYAKTMAAYANCKGGLIIFGVKNNPRTFPGLVDKKLEAFSSLDPERVTTALNDNFAPEIRWKHGTHTFKGRNFGYIYTFEAAEKPVIASRNFGEDVSEGAIYYRYGGKTQLIRFPELRQIMDEVKERLKKNAQNLYVTKAYIIQKLLEIVEFSVEKDEILAKDGTPNGKYKLKDASGALRALISLSKLVDGCEKMSQQNDFDMEVDNLSIEKI